jgi:hypothetical protein
LKYPGFIFIPYFLFLSSKVLSQQSLKVADLANDTLLKFDAPIQNGHIALDLGARAGFDSFDASIGITNISKYPVVIPAALIGWYDGGIMRDDFALCITLLPDRKVEIPIHIHPIERQKGFFKSGAIPITINNKVLFYPIYIKVVLY